MRLPDFSDWKLPSPLPSVRGSDRGNDDDEEIRSVEMSVSAASRRSAAGREESWEDNDDSDHHDGRARQRRRRKCTSDKMWCSPSSCCCNIFSTLLQPGSQPGAIANLCSATLGAGVLSLPFALSKCGIIPGLFLLVIAALATITSIDMVIETCHTLQLQSYEEVTLKLLGKKATYLVEISIFIFCFGCAVAYVVAVGDILQQGIIGVFATVLPKYITREFCMVAFWTLVMLPLSLLSRIDSLRFASLFGIGSIAFLVAACVVHSVRDLIEMSGHDHHGGNSTANGTDIWFADASGVDYLGAPQNHAGEDVRWILPSSFWDVVRACPIVMFAFSCQVNVCAIYDELGGEASEDSSNNDNADNETAGLTQTRRRGNISAGPTLYRDDDDKTMASVTRSAVLICVLFYSFIGMFAYLDFGPRTQDNVLKNYCVHDTHDPMMIAAFVCITIAVVMAFPLNVFPARVTLEGVIKRLLRNNEDQEEEAGDGGDGVVSQDDDDDALLERPLLDEAECDDEQPEQEPDAVASASDIMNDTRTESSSSSAACHIALTLIISGGALLVALIVPDISVVFGLMGGTASSIICFIFPGLFVIKIKEREDGIRQQLQLPPTLWRKIQAWILILGGTLIGILSTGVTLYSTFQDESDGKPADVCSG